MYYLIFCIFYLLSLLPFWLLYFFSDVLYLLLFYVVGYRKSVVFANLKQAFPEKSERDRERIAKKFYRNLTDQIIETIKMISISKRQIQKRVSYDSPVSVFNYLKENERSCQIHIGHFFNWEWANLRTRLLMQQPLLGVYKPPSNKTTDRLLKYIRSRFGTVLIASTNLLSEMKPYKNIIHVNVLIADQHPPNPRRVYWFPFLNKMTSFFKGPELSAKRNDLAIVFGNIQKIKRGYYKIETELAFEHAKGTDEGEITEDFVQFLEERIRRQPENWLWSHKRWKREWKGETNK